MMTRRRRWYFVIMGTCLTLFILSWSVIRLVSVPAAVVLGVLAMCLPPLAAIIGNARDRDERWWDEPPRPRPRIPRQRRPDDRHRTPPG